MALGDIRIFNCADILLAARRIYEVAPHVALDQADPEKRLHITSPGAQQLARELWEREVGGVKHSYVIAAVNALAEFGIVDDHAIKAALRVVGSPMFP